MSAGGRTSRQLAAAFRYAAHGWPVFPTRPNSDPCRNQQDTGCACKAPAPLRGETESHGFREASTDPDKVRWLWDRAGLTANVGIATGSPGPDVVDVDQHGERGNGFAVWNKAKAAGLVDNPQALIRTPSGGLHAYFAGSGQPSGSIRGQHIDFKAQGGYVLAPPSMVHGRPYEVWEHQAEGSPVDWKAIRDLVDPQPERPRRDWAARTPGPDQELDHLVRYVAECTDHVNERLFWAACRMVEAGQHDRLPELVQAAYDAGEDRRGQAERTVKSAERTAAEPRPFGQALQRQAEAG